MSDPNSRPRRKRRIGLLAPIMLVTAVALTIWVVAGVSASFNPEAEIIISDDTAEANADVTSNFHVPAPDVNFESVATYFPPEWGIATDAEVPDGTEVGSLDAAATLGLAIGGGNCNIALAPSFTLYDATTEGSGFASEGDMIGGTWNGYDPDCSGQGNGEKAICEYPAFLDELFPTRPIARYYGHAVVTAGIESALNFLVFEPGTSLGAGVPDDEEWGYPSVTILNDTGTENPNPQPSSLADFCTPLTSNNTIMGEVDGIALRTNPDCGGTYVFRSWSRGLPDADGDGYENGFDTCPYDVNADGDPRLAAGSDPDGDQIDSACDPEPAVACYAGAQGSTFDPGGCDADGYHTRADNCPMNQNGIVGQTVIGDNNQADADDDGIGDSCDLNPATTDGDRPELTIEMPIDIEGPACGGAETATPTATPTATAAATGTATATGTPTPEGTATPTTVAGEGCAPVIPGTYNGLVRLNGVPAAAGYEVTATIDGVDWGSTIVSGGRYALDVPQKLPAAEPCFAGGTITFAINGATCEPTEEWASGLHDVDLSCAAAPTVVPPTVPPGTPTVPTTPVVTPIKPPTTGAGGLLGGDEGVPLWALALAGWAGLMALAGFGTVATRIAKR